MAPQNSVFYHTTHSPVRRPALAGVHKADVAIIGGGYAGLSAALHLAKAGQRVMLCERAHIGDGPSGRNGGQVLSGFEADVADLMKQVGANDAGAIWQLVEETRMGVVARAQAKSCDYQKGMLTTALGPRQMQGLREAQHELQEAFGFVTELLDAEQIKAHVRSPHFIGGLYYPDAGHFNPYKYAHVLAAEAEAAGVQIFEQSEVTHWSGQGLQTRAGRVEAQAVLITAGAEQSWPTQDYVRFSTYMMATAPLSPAQLREVFPGTAAINDARLFLSYARPLADGRVLFGGADSLWERKGDSNLKHLKREMAWLYPALADVAIDHYWSGPIDFSRSFFPNIRQVEAGVYQANGFSGHGVTVTHLYGQAMAEAVLGEAGKFQLLSRLNSAPLPRNRWLALAQLGLPMLPEYVGDLLHRY